MSDRDLLISQYIDDELSIDEKISFVHEINSDRAYFEEAVSFLEMEKGFAVAEPPKINNIKLKKPLNLSLYASFTALAASVLVLVKVFVFSPEQSVRTAPHRFVVYMPEASVVELAGSFSAWQPIKMQRVSGGYWQAVLPLESGEYSYNYIIDGKEPLPDPTVPAKQDDGFGGESSIISIGEKI